MCEGEKERWRIKERKIKSNRCERKGPRLNSEWTEQRLEGIREDIPEKSWYKKRESVLGRETVEERYQEKS